MFDASVVCPSQTWVQIGVQIEWKEIEEKCRKSLSALAQTRTGMAVNGRILSSTSALRISLKN